MEPFRCQRHNVRTMGNRPPATALATSKRADGIVEWLPTAVIFVAESELPVSLRRLCAAVGHSGKTLRCQMGGLGALLEIDAGTIKQIGGRPFRPVVLTEAGRKWLAANRTHNGAACL